MTFQIRVGSATAAALLLMAAHPALAAETAKVPGDQWEVTTQMSMEGMDMAMPAQTVKVCAPKTWQEPPAPANEQQKCKNSDFKLVGPKATWKVTCSDPPFSDANELKVSTTTKPESR